ncbi:myrosinase 1-like [Cylas formicarius]|uniref:myrosinase 1-like n=1 Tax=Cylas formicarius TaxID=197179 RepID=UPI002958B859|nr:myrosinase 1-like [Cylas formicarius]
MHRIPSTISLFFVVIGTASARRHFPDGFKFGASTSAYQIEGAWDVDGKGQNVWDSYTHILSVISFPTADIACDSYHKWEEDIQILKTLGVQTYRLSISWSRILPNGTADYVNEKGVQYYLKILKALKANGIEPIVTIYHGDLPVPMNDIGGWINPKIIDYFSEYARICFDRFGSYVNYWLTLNEPRRICPPGEINIGWGVLKNYVTGEAIYECSYIINKAHAKAYHIYDEEFRSSQNGKVSIVLDVEWLEPYTNSSEDLGAVEREFEFSLGRFANPIYLGNWPQIVIERVATRSSLEGYNVSRLPEMSQEDVEYIKGTHDFFALNMYTSFLVENEDEPFVLWADYMADKKTQTHVDPAWRPSNVTSVVSNPEGIRKLLKYINDRYQPSEIFITENGWPDGNTELQDTERIEYLEAHLSNVLDAIHEDNVNVVGYSMWSLLDNYEWIYGYRVKYGLVQIDFDNPNRTRTFKDSAKWYQKVIAARCLDEVCET